MLLTVPPSFAQDVELGLLVLPLVLPLVSHLLEHPFEYVELDVHVELELEHVDVHVELDLLELGLQKIHVDRHVELDLLDDVKHLVEDVDLELVELEHLQDFLVEHVLVLEQLELVPIKHAT